jgi:hypothetical protein
MLNRFSTAVLISAGLMMVMKANAEDGHWSQQMDMSTKQTGASTNRWQGNFPESSQTSSMNPWSGSDSSAGPLPETGTDPGHSFVVPSKQKKFPELDYSPYEEGRKKIESRQSASTPGVATKQKQVRPKGNMLPNYQRPAYPRGGAPYGGYYPPSPYGGGYGYPWSGGGYPFSSGAPWGGANSFPFFNGGSPWNGGSGFPVSPFNW